MIPPLIINSSRIEKVVHEDWILSPDVKLYVREETEHDLVLGNEYGENGAPPLSS